MKWNVYGHVLAHINTFMWLDFNKRNYWFIFYLNASFLYVLLLLHFYVNKCLFVCILRSDHYYCAIEQAWNLYSMTDVYLRIYYLLRLHCTFKHLSVCAYLSICYISHAHVKSWKLASILNTKKQLINCPNNGTVTMAPTCNSDITEHNYGID